MKCIRTVLICCVLAPGAADAQNVRVRLYTNRPPESFVVRSVQGELRWKACESCEERVANELKIGKEFESAEGGTNSEEFYLAGKYQLRPNVGPNFTTGNPSHIKSENGHLLVTVALPLEEYVAAVLEAESGGFENTEAQKAMAVAARTYALRFLGQHAKDGFDFCDTTHCQVFGWKAAPASVRSAVDATKGETLRYAGKLAETYYHQNCGGTTAAAAEVWPNVSQPYLASHADRFCVTRGALLWETTLRVQEIDRALRSSSVITPTGWRRLLIAERTASGRAQRLKFEGGTSGSPFMSASTFRFAVNRALGWDKIRSSFFALRSEGGDAIIFSGRGSGHGVGLCQAGAEEMAREGKNYRDILGFYYPGTQILAAESSQRTQWQTRRADRVELLSTQPNDDARVLAIAARILNADENQIGWRAKEPVRLQIYPTLDAYRNSTGQPGWVAASTRGRTIRLQPLKELQKRGILESTLRHEVLHVLVEAKAAPNTPLWFREGIVLVISNDSAQGPETPELTDDQIEAVLRHPANREEVQKAYAAAASRVSVLMQHYGKESVLGWLSAGIPRDVRSGVASGPTSTNH